MKNLAKAVITVMKNVRGMEKSSKVGSGNSSYNGTKDQDVKDKFNVEMAKAGLCMIPIDYEETTDVNRWEVKGQYSTQMKQSVFTKVNAKYLLLHESGESITVAGYGHGVDPQDKGSGKATTYAMKNALLYTFMTPVGRIDDAETTHSDDVVMPSKETENPEAKAQLKKAQETIEKVYNEPVKKQPIKQQPEAVETKAPVKKESVAAKPKSDDKPKLTKEGFDYLMKCKDIDIINQAIETRSISKSYSSKLTEEIKSIKESVNK